jgi:hypothetical protein
MAPKGSPSSTWCSLGTWKHCWWRNRAPTDELQTKQPCAIFGARIDEKANKLSAIFPQFPVKKHSNFSVGLDLMMGPFFHRTEGAREQAAVAGVFGPFHCSWSSDFRTPTLKNHQKGMPPNGPASLDNAILLKIDVFCDEA